MRNLNFTPYRVFRMGAFIGADGGRVLVIGDYHAGIKGTDDVIQIPFVHVWDTRDGKLSTARSYTDTVAVQAAAARGRP